MNYCTTILLAGLGGSVLMVGLVFACGLTFGQICEKEHPGDTQAQGTCVREMRQGTK